MFKPNKAMLDEFIKGLGAVINEAASTVPSSQSSHFDGSSNQQNPQTFTQTAHVQSSSRNSSPMPQQRQQQASSSSTIPSQPPPQSTVSCSGCNITICHTTCMYCGDQYCKACLIQEVRFSMNGDRHWLCRRCVVFSTGDDLTKDVLMKMSVKDLKWVLSRSARSCQTLLDKEQLVEAVMELHASDARRREVEERSRRAQNMRAELNDKLRVPSPMEVDVNEEPDPENPLPSYPPPPYSKLYPQGPPSAPEDKPPPATKAPSKVESLLGGNQRILLDELECVEMIERLSVKQLKDLLASNFVDYKGCVERQELQVRAIRLWKSHEENKKVAEEQNQSVSSSGNKPGAAPLPSECDDKCCRICMENVIDCVFLDCGHMVACVTCGKLMAECPICRQNVVRVVRVFHS